MNEERGWRAGAALSSKRRSPRTPFLIGMSEHHIHLLADCAMRSRFEAGHLIFREGETANRFYLIERGKVALESSTLGEPVEYSEKDHSLGFELFKRMSAVMLRRLQAARQKLLNVPQSSKR